MNPNDTSEQLRRRREALANFGNQDTGPVPPQPVPETQALPQDPATRRREALRTFGQTMGAPAPGATAPEEPYVPGFGGQFVGGAINSAAAAARLGEAAGIVSEGTSEDIATVAEPYAPRVQGVQDIRTDSVGGFASDALNYVGSAIAQSLPEMAALGLATVAGTVVGGPVGGVALPVAVSTLFNAGRNLQRQDQEFVDEDIYRAVGAGVGQGFLDRFVPGRVGAQIGEAFGLRIAGAMSRSIPREALRGARDEAITETLQQMIEIGQADPELLRILVAPKTPGEVERSDGLMLELVNAAVGGGTAGGVISGAVRAVTGPARERERETDSSVFTDETTTMPLPEPEPEPDVVTEPEDGVEPAPAPEPEVDPATPVPPEPTPEPAPAPAPVPQPQPAPEPEPVQAPEPVPAPPVDPVPAPAPAPAPTPSTPRPYKTRQDFLSAINERVRAVFAIGSGKAGIAAPVGDVIDVLNTDADPSATSQTEFYATDDRFTPDNEAFSGSLLGRLGTLFEIYRTQGEGSAERTVSAMLRGESAEAKSKFARSVAVWLGKHANKTTAFSPDVLATMRETLEKLERIAVKNGVTINLEGRTGERLYLTSKFDKNKLPVGMRRVDRSEVETEVNALPVTGKWQMHVENIVNKGQRSQFVAAGGLEPVIDGRVYFRTTPAYDNAITQDHIVDLTKLDFEKIEFDRTGKPIGYNGVIPFDAVVTGFKDNASWAGPDGRYVEQRPIGDPRRNFVRGRESVFGKMFQFFMRELFADFSFTHNIKNAGALMITIREAVGSGRKNGESEIEKTRRIIAEVKDNIKGQVGVASALNAKPSARRNDAEINAKLRFLSAVVNKTINKLGFKDLKILLVVDSASAPDAVGRASYLGNGLGVIELSRLENIKKEQLYFTLMHEVGHVITSYIGHDASTAAQRHSLLYAYNRDLQVLNKRQALGQDISVVDYYRFLHFARMPGYTVPRTTQLNEGMRLYVLGFNEWLAENFVKYITGPQHYTKTPFGRFVSKLFDALWTVFTDAMVIVSPRYGQELIDKFNNSQMFESPPEFDAFIQQAIEGDGTGGIATAMHLPEVIGSTPNGAPIYDDIETGATQAALDIADARVPVAVRQNMAAAKKTADKYNFIYKYGLTILQLADRNKHIDWLRTHVQLAEKWYNEKMRWLSRANETVEGWTKLAADQQKALADFIFAIDNLEFLTAAERTQGVVRKPTPAEKAALAQRLGLKRTGADVYEKVRADFDAVLAKIEQLVMADIDRVYGPNDPIGAVEKAVAAKEFNAMKRRPYFPHARFGDYAIIVKDNKGKVLYSEHFASRKEAKSAYGRIKGRYPSSTPALTKIDKETKSYLYLPPAMLRRIMTSLTLNAKQKEMLKSLMIDAAPAQSFRKHFGRRDNVAGFSRDALRAYGDYFFHAANHISKLEHGESMQRNIEDATKATRALGDTGTDIIDRVNILQHVKDHLEYILHPGDEWQFARSAAFTWHIAGVPASAVLNLTQIPIVTLPYLSARYGDVKSLAMLPRVMAEIRTTLAKGTASNLSQQDLAQINLALQQGFIDESMAMELASLAEGSALTFLRAGTQAHRLVLRASKFTGWMFEQSEKLNRRVTFRMAVKLARENPNTPYLAELRQKYTTDYAAAIQQHGMSPAEATAFIAGKDAVRTSQFEYANWARPRFMRGKASVFTTFMMFLQNSLYFARYDKGNLRYMLMLFLAAGLMGLPGAEDLAALAKLTARQFDKNFDVEQELREYLISIFGDEEGYHELILHGAGRRGFGLAALGQMAGMPVPEVDMSGAVGMGRVVPGLAELGRSGGSFNDTVANVATDMAGASLAIPASIIKFLGGSQYSLSDMKRWEPALPRAIRSPMTAARWAQEGRERSVTGATVLDFDVTDPEQAAEVAAKALGFNPTRLSRRWDRIIAQSDAEAYWAARRTMLTRAYDEARQSGVRENVAKVVQRIRTFNGEAPQGLAIGRDTLQRSVRSRELARAKREAGLPNTRMMTGVYDEIRRNHPEDTPTEFDEPVNTRR